MGLGAIGDPSVAEPFRVAIAILTAFTGLLLAFIGLGLTVGEWKWVIWRRGGDGVAVIQKPRGRTLPEALEDDDEPASRKRRAPVITTPETRHTIIADRATPRPRPRRPRPSAPTCARRHATSCPASTCSSPPPPPANTDARQGRARAQRAPARKPARRFLGQGRDRRGAPRPGGHDVRAGARARHQGEPRHPARRRHRPQHVGHLRPGRHHPRPQRDRHRAAQSPPRDGRRSPNWSRAPPSTTRCGAADRCSARTSRAIRSSPISRRCRICWSPAPPVRASRSASTA